MSNGSSLVGSEMQGISSLTGKLWMLGNCARADDSQDRREPPDLPNLEGGRLLTAPLIGFADSTESALIAPVKEFHPWIHRPQASRPSHRLGMTDAI